MKKFFSLLLIFILLSVNITPLQGIPLMVTDINLVPSNAKWAVTVYGTEFFYGVENNEEIKSVPDPLMLPANANWVVSINQNNNQYYYSDGISIYKTEGAATIPNNAVWAVENFPDNYGLQFCYPASNSTNCVSDIYSIPVGASWVTVNDSNSILEFFHGQINTPPSANYGNITLDGNMYTFSISDFQYYDADGDKLHHIRIKGQTNGALIHDKNNNNYIDPGEYISTERNISRQSIEQGELKYLENTSRYGSFRFDVHDGTSYSNETYTMLIDHKPTVIFYTYEISPTNTNPIPITIVFSETVTGLDVNDFTVSNGEVTSVSGYYETHNIEITPNNDGEVTLTLNENAVIDNMGNGNKASYNFTVVYDSTPPANPTIQINNGAAVTNSTSVVLHVSHEEENSQNEMQFSTNGGTWSQWSQWEPFSSIKNFILQDVDGEQTISMRLRDKAGNQSEIAFDSIQLDRIAPVVEGVTNNSIYSTERTVIFTEGVATLNGIEIPSNTVISQEGSYTLIVKDDAGNSTTVRFTIDRTAPTISYTKNPSTWTNGNVIVSVYMNEYGELKWAKGSHDESYMNTHGEQITNGAFVATENGTYTILAKDIAGNTTVTEIEVSNIDRDQPVITLNGDQTIQIKKGQAYTELGYAVIDETEGDLTDSVTVNDNVDTSTIGTYTVTYSVKDTAGNDAEVSRKVEVIPTKVTLTGISAQLPSIDVKNAEPNATLYLMNEANEQVAIGTANENGTYTFDAIDFETNYYVVQEVNQLQSVPSNVTVIHASSNNSLTNLESSDGSLSPNFDSDVLDYELVVDNAITTISLVPTTANEQASVKINGKTVASGDTSENIPLNVGDNVLTIEVTAGDQSIKTYTVHVKRLSNNADLSNIELSVGALNETFASDATNYTAILADEANQVTITATKSDALADVKIQSESTNSTTIDLVEGDNLVEIEVMAEDGTTKMYTVNIQYVKNIYSIHFETNGGISMNAMPVKFDAPLNLLPIPIKVGYTFDAWYTDEALTEPLSLQSATMPAEDVTLYAKWKINEYKVIFQDALGMEMDSQFVQHGDAAIAPQPPIRIGYTFTGWDRDFSNVTGDLIISPIYEINQYTVIFQDYDGTELAREVVYFGHEASEPIHPTRIGYTFIDWDKTFEFVAENLQITAQYAINQYEITFDSEGGSNVEPIAADYNALLEAPTPPTKEGYTFKGWYTDEALIEAFNWENATMSAENLTLHAKWQINEYEVTFLDGDGQVWHTTNVKHGSKATVPANPTKDGYLFTGWDVDFTSIISPLTVTAQFIKKIDAIKPLVQVKTTSNEAFQGDASPIVSVEATIEDSGKLSYEWYKSTSSTEAGQKVAGATSSEYAVPTNNVGTFYYYVTVTNTNEQATGEQKAVTTSERIKVDIKKKSNNALLSNLTIGENLELSPVFEQNQYEYKMFISPSVTTIPFTPTKMNKYAKVEVNGQLVESGKQTKVDAESIIITVTAQDSTKQQYTINLVNLVKEKVADVIVKDKSVEVNTEDIEVLDQNGVLVTNLTDKSENVSLKEEQLEQLRRKHAIIQSKKKDAALSIPASNFKDEGPLHILMTLFEDPQQQQVEKAKERAVGSIYKFMIKQGDKVISTFEDPIEITFPIDTTVENPEELPEELKVYYFNEETKKWELIGGELIGRSIVARTNHFSVFGVFHPDDILVLNGEQQVEEEQPTEEVKDPEEEPKQPVEEPINEQPTKEPNEQEETPVKQEEPTKQQELPNTATNMYNWILIGILLLLAGITIRISKQPNN
ncbi:InlB B-repeat-containing protein [Gracilibacillus marinus]|uniref:InlB B-repeat-containing protein n=1 Tax=Gracilibacillus marinus TaxID=630535 RepID=A0ABV8VQ29_9BACI